MLVGQKNKINDKLVEEISQVFTISFKDINDVLNGNQSDVTPRIIILNLMDVSVQEKELLTILKSKYPNIKVIGIHCYQSQKMIVNTLNKGYDSYLSIFNISEDFKSILKRST